MATNVVNFVRDYDFDDKIPASDYSEILTARSVSECAASCTEQTDCKSFFYTTSTTTCRYHSDVLSYISYTGTLNNSLTSKYFVAEEYGVACKWILPFLFI